MQNNIVDTTMEPQAKLKSSQQRTILVGPAPADRKTGEAQRRAKTVDRLKDWQYLERSLHRLIAGWGRHFCEWDDITACHRHVWEQSECVRRLRDRIGQFPGAAQNLEAPVSAKLEELVNTVLLAPSFEDALSGIYQELMGSLCKSYQLYAASAHPIHDAPTIATLHEVIGFHEQMRLWLREYRRRNPHKIDAAYKAAIQAELRNCGDLLDTVPILDGQNSAPAGVRTNFRLPAKYGLPRGPVPAYDIMPFLRTDFPSSIEARRLFWAYAYMLEITLAIEQLRWIYDGHYMPWEFLQDISRHLWDESRHGDSGHSRLLDFGITIADVGFPPHLTSEQENLAQGQVVRIVSSLVDERGSIEPLTPQQLYEAVFLVGMIAETGHFVVKRQAYDDFIEGGDLESAEMMLFDIIDETTHVQYAHKWLPLLADEAGVDNTAYKERATTTRAELQQAQNDDLIKWADLPRDYSNRDYAKYQELLEIMRREQPLSNADTCPKRDSLPM